MPTSHKPTISTGTTPVNNNTAKPQQPSTKTPSTNNPSVHVDQPTVNKPSVDTPKTSSTPTNNKPTQSTINQPVTPSMPKTPTAPANNKPTQTTINQPVAPSTPNKPKQPDNSQPSATNPIPNTSIPTTSNVDLSKVKPRLNTDMPKLKPGQSGGNITYVGPEEGGQIHTISDKTTHVPVAHRPKGARRPKHPGLHLPTINIDATDPNLAMNMKNNGLENGLEK